MGKGLRTFVKYLPPQINTISIMQFAFYEHVGEKQREKKELRNSRIY